MDGKRRGQYDLDTVWTACFARAEMIENNIGLVDATVESFPGIDKVLYCSCFFLGSLDFNPFLR